MKIRTRRKPQIWSSENLIFGEIAKLNVWKSECPKLVRSAFVISSSELWNRDVKFWTFQAQPNLCSDETWSCRCKMLFRFHHGNWQAPIDPKNLHSDVQTQIFRFQNQSLRFRIQIPIFRIQNSYFRIMTLRIQNSYFQISDSEFQNSDFGIQICRLRLSDRGIRLSDFRIQIPENRISGLLASDSKFQISESDFQIPNSPY